MRCGQAGVAVHVTRRSDVVRMQDLRRLMRLEGALSELPAGSEARRRHAMTGLASIVGARVVVSGSLAGLAVGQPVLEDALDEGFDGEHERAVFRGYVDQAQERFPDPSFGGMYGRLAPPVSTFLRTELVGDSTWYRSPHVQELRRIARVDSVIYGVRLLGPDTGAAIGLHRAWGERPFGEYERNLVDAFLHESRGFLPARSPSQGTLPELPRRLAQTMSLLAEGLSEKQVAAELGLSAHTVHDYVKELHRRFAVQSRGELLAEYNRLLQAQAPPRH